MSKTIQLEKNIAFCIDELELDEGISSVEYFCEEFVFECFDNEGNVDLDALDRVHDENYLPIQWRLD